MRIWERFIYAARIQPHGVFIYEVEGNDCGLMSNGLDGFNYNNILAGEDNFKWLLRLKALQLLRPVINNHIYIRKIHFDCAFRERDGEIAEEFVEKG